MDNLLAETRFPKLRNFVEEKTFHVIPKLFNSPSAIIHNDVITTMRYKSRYKKTCTIRLYADMARNLPFELSRKLLKQRTEPPWHLKGTKFIRK